MLRDITIGQHFPGNSLVHRFDPRLKLVLTILYIVLLFAASNPLGLALSLIFLAVMYAVAKIPFKLILKSLKPIFPIIVFTAVLNLFFVSGEGDPVFKLGFLTVYAEGIRYAVLMAVRVMALIAGTSLLTYTTSPIVLTDAIEQLLKPLGKLHFPVHELAMMMSIALRFIPTLIEETDKIMNAQKARGAMLDNGSMMERVKALVDEDVDAVVLDSAHGHSANIVNALMRIKAEYPKLDVVVGNIATAEAARYLIDHGADGIKVVIGPGSICTTRIIAGVGVPQLSAIYAAASAAKGSGVPVIADGAK